MPKTQNEELAPASGSETDAVEVYDQKHGKYQEMPDLPEDTKFATGNMPQAPDPSPFKLGPTTPGSRE